ncbi:outer membrane beta-barrel protein [Bradyrhizobium sp. AUGA SZCCT0222]|uniref:outer membrane beta-barrel protein n=1 Tax=Bradyrhizobium sp. AUGA SZCCT0222 TaxID=2807668 RepID=UPI001BAD5E06|nr:outer membrane beta-barrel protein [Bradyrhizobium sp. AUGA SZCCT0222]MBR1266889.1 outer membrane beta-barrel protein [Bradyrhizobium sp. AUGA SZCCT0222]
MAGPVRGQSRRATAFRAVLPCLALIVLTGTIAQAQTVTPDLFSPTRSSQLTPVDSPLRRTNAEANDKTSDDANDARVRDKEKPAPSRIGAIPRYGLPAASGASSSGYDSLNRKLQKPKYYPGQVRPKPPPGPGSRPPLLSNTPLRLSIPPSQTANKAPIPPAMAGTVVGQPARKRLKIDDDPFGAVGDYAGSFLIKSALELRGGYDTNPARIAVPRGSPFYVVAPEFLAVSDWERHALVADLKGSFTGYTNTFPPVDGVVSSAPTNVDRPNFNGHVDGRLDVSRDTRLLGQARLLVATDNPGSPNIQAGLARYPVYATFGGTFGVDQNFNRLQLSAGAAVDRTVYQNSQLTDGTSTTNDDRNYNQFGGLGRVSYDLMPGLKPFGEIEGNVRSHDLLVDRNGYQRNSNGGSVRAGTTFEFSRILTGELAVGWAARTYEDPRLLPLQGLLTSASLVWVATPLTTAKFFATTTINETTVPGVSGVLTRTYTAEVDHDFRRWLTGIGKFTWGTQTYQGDQRFDRFYSLSGDLIYKMNRNLWITGTLRRDWLDSNQPGNSTAATIVMLGVRLQH